MKLKPEIVGCHPARDGNPRQMLNSFALVNYGTAEERTLSLTQMYSFGEKFGRKWRERERWSERWLSGKRAKTAKRRQRKSTT